MRLPVAASLLISALLGSLKAGEGESAAVVGKQKQAAEANCRAVQLVPLSRAESLHFLVYGVQSDARLKSVASQLERHYAAAFKALQFGKDDKPWPGKLTVYVFPDRTQFRSFIRRVEKRSPDEGEQSSVGPVGDLTHVAAAPGQGKEAVSPEVQAGYGVAIALMTARAKGTQAPEWLTQGFARATTAHATEIPGGVRKRVARQLAGRIKPSEVWNDTLPIEQRLPLATSVADFLFYGNGLSRPADFLRAFRPDEDKPKAMVDALEAGKLTPEKFEAGYLAWLRSNN